MLHFAAKVCQFASPVPAAAHHRGGVAVVEGEKQRKTDFGDGNSQRLPNKKEITG